MSQYRTLSVWQDSMNLAQKAFPICTDLREERLFGISDQLFRSSISIPSNIAEGAASGSKGNFVRYLNVANGSTAELRTQVELVWHLGHINQHTFLEIDDLADKISAKIHKLKKQLES